MNTPAIINLRLSEMLLRNDMNDMKTKVRKKISGKPDLNRRPQVPQTCTLTNCAIARFVARTGTNIIDKVSLCQYSRVSIMNKHIRQID